MNWNLFSLDLCRSSLNYNGTYIKKHMLSLQEDIHTKTVNLIHTTDVVCHDNHNVYAEGRPTKKRFAKSSLRIKPLITSSSTITYDERVVDIHATIEKYRS